MLQIALHNGYQLTMPKAIIEQANIHQDDTFAISYEAGKIVLIKTSKQTEEIEKTSIMDFIGSMKGVYGETPEQIDHYLAEERQSWDKSC